MFLTDHLDFLCGPVSAGALNRGAVRGRATGAARPEADVESTAVLRLGAVEGRSDDEGAAAGAAICSSGGGGRVNGRRGKRSRAAE